MPPRDEIREVVIEDARILWPNFAGAELPMNAPGDRNFNVALDPKTADDLIRWGWNVKTGRSRDEEETPEFYIAVTVGYKIRPPMVWMITKRGKTHLTEEMVGLLDEAEISVADIIVRGVPWERHGRSGIKAYLKTGFFTINEDYLQEKYADVPEAAG